MSHRGHFVILHYAVISQSTKLNRSNYVHWLLQAAETNPFAAEQMQANKVNKIQPV